MGPAEGRPRGGAVRRCEGRLGSGAPPPPAARRMGGLSGSATHVPCARVCGRGGPAPAPWPACPVEAARHRGGGGRLGSGAPSSLLPALWAGCWGPLATCCWRGCGCVRRLWFLCGACRGAWCRLSPVPLVLPSLVLRCGVVPAVCRVPAVLPSLRASLARLLATSCFFRAFVALYTFPCSLFSLACTFSLPPPWCVSLSFSSPACLSLSLRPVRQRKDGGMWAFGGSMRWSCNVGTTFVAASPRITYLPSHLCLHVCACSSPFAPYHVVLMSLSPYPHLFLCCLLWCRCTPYAKRACVGGGPRPYSSPCSLVGPTPLFVSVGGAGRASVVRIILALAPRPGICPHLFLLFFSLVAPLVCAAWHNTVTYLCDSLLSLLIFSCDACLVAVVLPIQMSVGGRGSFLLVSSSSRSWCTPLLARALAALPCPCACTCACFSPPWRGSVLTCVWHGSTHLFGYLCL